MKIEVFNKDSLNATINISNHEVTFVEGKAEVSDEIGKEICEKHDWVYPEGVGETKKEEPLVDPVDEAIVHKLTDQVAKLKMSNNSLKQAVASLRDENKTWREKTQELTKELEDKVKKETFDYVIKAYHKGLSKDPTAVEMLSEMGLDDLKYVANKVGVPTSTVGKKNKKEDWVIAIKEYKK